MGEYIDEFGGEHVDVLNGMAGSIRDHLLAGPVLLGERHDKPAARAVAVDLMVARCVTTLFLELNSLTELRAQGGERMLTWILGLLDKRHQNPITFVKLLEIAKSNEVHVIGYDNPTSEAGKGSPASPKGMKHRNKVMGKALREHGNAGSIAIVGSQHFAAEPSGGRTLQEAAEIPAPRFVDLSSYY